MRALIILVTLLIIVGCASPTTTSTCHASQCVLQEARQELAKTCMSDLFMYPKHKRAAIDAEYGYPLTNYDTFFSFANLGQRGPNPEQWCRRYAAQKISVVMPVTLPRSSR